MFLHKQTSNPFTNCRAGSRGPESKDREQTELESQSPGFPNRILLGFTALELLVVIGTVSLLALAVLAPSLASTKPGVATFVCMSNLRQLGSAWQMYADDYNNHLVYNRDGTSTGRAMHDEGWVGGWLDVNGANTDNTNTALLIDHAQFPYGAYLGPYLKSADVFRCPADGSIVTIGNQQFHRVRSYSMNNTFGQEARMWTVPSRYTLHTSISDIKFPTQVFVLLEELKESINDGCFFSNPDTRWNLIDYPADYHHASCNFLFADGHVELHRWKDSRTTPVLIPGFTSLPLNITYTGNVDVDWLQQHATELR